MYYIFLDYFARRAEPLLCICSPFGASSLLKPGAWTPSCYPSTHYVACQRKCPRSNEIPLPLLSHWRSTRGRLGIPAFSFSATWAH